MPIVFLIQLSSLKKVNITLHFLILFFRQGRVVMLHDIDSKFLRVLILTLFPGLNAFSVNKLFVDAINREMDTNLIKLLASITS